MYWNSRQVTDKRALPITAATRDTARAALQVAAAKVAALADRHPDYFPLYTDQGRWKHGKDSWTNWCEGFLGGQMWLFYEAGLGDDWRTRAVHYSRLVENRQHDRDVHDLGFVLCPTWQKWAELDGGADQKKVVVQGGRTMALRLNQKGGYLRSFLAPDSNFIDIMMNVGIIALAALETGDDQLMAIALRHCETTRKYLVRGDGSVSHEGIFDLDTGEFLRQSTQQGWRNDSSWARGLAWSLYGFTSMYALTGEKHLLHTAIANADYWLEHTTGDPVPPNDFDEPQPARPWESSAAACAAGGLLMLATLVDDDEQAQRYHQHAQKTVLRLCEPLFLAADPAWEGVLMHGSYHERKHLGVNESVMWGDYFFVETLARVVRAG